MDLKKQTEIIYYMLIKGIKLTYKNMLLNELTSDDISFLLNNSIVFMKDKIDSFGSYGLKDADEFRKYGENLLVSGNIKDAIRCFEICYQIDPSNKEICMHYLLNQLKKNNYEEVLKGFKQLENVNNVDVKFNNLILYLLNCVTKLPKEYKDRISCFELEDISFDENTNQVVECIYNSRFKDAYELINNMLAKNVEYLVSLKLIWNLLRKIFEKNGIINKTIESNICDENYAVVVDILRELQTKRRLTYNETYTLLLCNAIVKIKETSIIPKVYECDSMDIYDMIICNDFETALKKLKRTEEIRNNLLHTLLVEINKLIRKIRNEKLENQENEYRNIIESAYGYIWLFKEENISIEEGCKKHGVGLELSLLIRIIDAKDNYDEDSRKMFYDELRKGEYTPSNVMRFLDEIENEEKDSKKVKVPVKKRYRIRHYDGKKELITRF